MGPVATLTAQRRWIAVRGVVQGVGFRPFVYRLAREHGLTGWVRNTGAGVEIEIEGDASRLDSFTRALRMQAPPLACIDTLEQEPREPRRDSAFEILPSQRAVGEVQPISPDVATCTACLEEIFDPTARRYRYPFTNCTDCGPRFTIMEAMPYDRARTTMRGFALCDACRAEYEDPVDRRFHAEPIACPRCGPRLEFLETAHTGGVRPLYPANRSAPPLPRRERGPGGESPLGSGDTIYTGEDALHAAVAALHAGRIVALKGLGGFQLACDATDDDAVSRLRERKHREAKPFALMVPQLETARDLCHVSETEAQALAGPPAPILLLQRRESSSVSVRVAPSVATGLDTLGIMLPSTPLHHLLLREFGGPLVMTSGNRSDEPIAVENDEALVRLHGIADAFLLHDREIASRYDDSVVRVDRGDAAVLRRARGYAPEPIRLPRPARAPVLAVGSQLKNTFCLVRDDQAFVSQHIGDLDDAFTLAHYHRTLALYRRLFAVEPEVVAHDLHPDYAATRFARSLEGMTHVGVQHHHAHIVSCLAEHRVTDSVIGIAFDGTGYGTDGAVWGGELLIADWRGFRRTAHLAYLPLPGGDAAAHEPWRMALSALVYAFGEEADDIAAALFEHISASRRRPVLDMARRGFNAPPTSSAGRLFDAVAALAGIRVVNQYEGQAAMELEARVDQSETSAYLLPLAPRPGATRHPSPTRGEGTARRSCSASPLPSWERGPGGEGLDGKREPGAWDVIPLIRAVVDDVRRGTRPSIIAARFHNALAAAVLEGCRWVREMEGLNAVALSGGCFQNRRLLEQTRNRLEQENFRVLTHRLIPPNDGGISLGQAAVALATVEQ